MSELVDSGTVRAAVCRSHGLDGIAVEATDLAPLGDHDARVEVELAGLGHADMLVVQNKYQVKATVPFVPGSEFVGTVRAVGARVTNLAVGDRVLGTMFVGACAEQVVVPAASVQQIAAGVDPATIIAGGIAYETAYHALRSVAEVRPGQTVMVLGAGGGVGLAAVDVAVRFGATVVAAASSAEKLQAAAEVGAALTVDYSADDLRAHFKQCVPDGVDVVLDPVGGRWAEPALRLLRPGGRFVTVGFASGEIPSIPINLVLLKAISIVGFEFRSFVARHTDEFLRNRAELYDDLAHGRLHPRVSAVYPLAETARALQSIADRQAIGKVLIDVRN